MKTQSKFGGNSFTTMVLILLMLFPFSFIALGQKEPSIPTKKVMSITYGIKRLGHLEVNDKELAIGLHYLKSKNHSYNFILSGNFTEVETYVRGNPDWNYTEYSKGLDLSIDYGYMINMDNMVLYPSIGAVIRYSQERDLEEYSLSRDFVTGVYEWEYTMFNNNGFKAGYIVGLNLEYSISNNFSFGVRAYLKGFPGNRMRFGFIGIVIKSNRLFL